MGGGADLPAVIVPQGFAGVGFGSDLSRSGTPSIPPSRENRRPDSTGDVTDFVRPTGGQWATPSNGASGGRGAAGLTPASQGVQGVALESMQQECVESIEAREMLLRRLYGAALDQAQVRTGGVGIDS